MPASHDPRRLRPGGTPSYREQNAAADQLAALSRVGPGLGLGAGGLTLDPPPVTKIKARITSQPPAESGSCNPDSGSGSGSAGGSGSGSADVADTGIIDCCGYGYRQVVRVNCAWVDAAFGYESDYMTLPAFEDNDVQDVPVGSIVELTLAADQKSWTFPAPAGSSGGTGSGGSGSAPSGSASACDPRLAPCVAVPQCVECVDGVPSITSWVYLAGPFLVYDCAPDDCAGGPGGCDSGSSSGTGSGSGTGSSTSGSSQLGGGGNE